MTYRKKLIEVALPLEAINKAAAKEKSIRHGHPSTLHLWWARRPLAACRAVLFASLVDDPGSDPMFAGDEDLAASKRAELFNLIEELVQWENSNNSRVINRARAEIARCVATQKIEEGVFKKDEILNLPSPACGRGAGGEGVAKRESGKRKAEGIKVSVFEIRQLLAKPEQVNAFLAEYAPPVLDPFCGGGSIPLEAQRLGLRAYASDLNPVAVLITKALIEIPRKFAGLPPVNPEWQKKSNEEKAATVWERAQGLAEDVRYYGNRMRDEAERRIGHLYPKVKITKEMTKDRPDLEEYLGREMTVIAWLWARTVPSPNPACKGAFVPLVRSFWLSSKKGKEAWVEPVIDRRANSYCFRVRTGEPPQGFDANAGTVARNRRTCLISGQAMALEHVRQQAQEGRMGVRLMAIVVQGDHERLYLSPTADHEKVETAWESPDIPDTDLVENARYMTPTIYGMKKHRDLFTTRQLVTLSALCELTSHARVRVLRDSGGDERYADGVATYLGLCASKASVFCTALARWRPNEGKSAQAFGRQAVAMVWDFAEVNPFAGAGGDFAGIVDGASKTTLGLPAFPPCVASQMTAACPQRFDGVLSTDPPYYDS